MSKLLFLGGRVQLFDDDGAPLAGGKCYFYEPGTSTAKDTYTTSGLGVANANPVVLDAAGRASIHLNGSYKVVVKDSADVTVYTEDNVNPDDAGTASIANLALNGSFEDNALGDGKTPDHWTLTEESGSTVALDTSDQNHGLRSLAFTSAGSGGGNVQSTAFINVTPLRAYQLSFLIKCSVVDTLNIVKVHWYTAAGALVSSTTVYTDATANPTAWERNSAVVTPPSTARLAKIQLIGCDPSDATTGTTRFDDVIFAEGALVTTITTRGDLVIGDSTGEADRLGIGTDGQVLGSDGTDPSWKHQGWELLEHVDLTNGGADDLSQKAFDSALEVGWDYKVVVRNLSSTDASWFDTIELRNDAEVWLSSSGNYYTSTQAHGSTGVANASAAAMRAYSFSGFGGHAAADMLDFDIEITSPMDTGVRTTARGSATKYASTACVHGDFSGQAETVDGHDRVRVGVTPGTMDSGTASLYRRRAA